MQGSVVEGEMGCNISYSFVEISMGTWHFWSAGVLYQHPREQYLPIVGTLLISNPDIKLSDLFVENARSQIQQVFHKTNPSLKESQTQPMKKKENHWRKLVYRFFIIAFFFCVSVVTIISCLYF